MERGSDKHGPLHDDQMAHESEGMVRGAPQPPHTEEWRETEPAGPVPAAARDEETTPAPAGGDIELRSELAQVLHRDDFPAGRAALLTRLDEAGASGALIERVAALPSGDSFASAHDVMVALGINAPEVPPD